MYSPECDAGARGRVTAVTLQIQSPRKKTESFRKGQRWCGYAERHHRPPRGAVRCGAAELHRGRRWPRSPGSMCPLWGSHLATSQPRTCVRPVGMAIVVTDGRGRTGRIERHRPRMGRHRRYNRVPLWNPRDTQTTPGRVVAI